MSIDITGDSENFIYIIIMKHTLHLSELKCVSLQLTNHY